jgi:hypothetical protein
MIQEIEKNLKSTSLLRSAVRHGKSELDTLKDEKQLNESLNGRKLMPEDSEKPTRSKKKKHSEIKKIS